MQMQSQGSHLWNEIGQDFPGRRSVAEFIWLQILAILDDPKLILPLCSLEGVTLATQLPGEKHIESFLCS